MYLIEYDDDDDEEPSCFIYFIYYLFKILAKRQEPVHQLMTTTHIICPVSIQIGLEIV